MEVIHFVNIWLTQQGETPKRFGGNERKSQRTMDILSTPGANLVNKEKK